MIEQTCKPSKGRRGGSRLLLVNQLACLFVCGNIFLQSITGQLAMWLLHICCCPACLRNLTNVSEGAKKSGLMDDTKQEGARDPWSPGEATGHQLPEWGSLSFFWAFFSLLVSFMSQFLFDHCSNVKIFWLTAIFFRGLADKSYKGEGLSLKTGSEAEPLQGSNLRAKRESKESETTRIGKGDKKKYF